MLLAVRLALIYAEYIDSVLSTHPRLCVRLFRSSILPSSYADAFSYSFESPTMVVIEFAVAQYTHPNPGIP
jgi:hypothetical protein